MKLKSLEINGFKSFADKTLIEFKPGMTTIVGPNGSGKSNIIEAIRWVMGEQSAKGLRGDTMADVIFSGSKNRRAMGRAEVSMVIDNSDHYLSSPYNELRISRRLYRSGEAEYLLNGSKVRLRDITDIFIDTGLGRESFSIINQGKVEEIFNAKAADRRSIIEDLAGVFKYKQNKARSQNELIQTKDNLERLADIINEVSERLQPLETQAAEAEKYLSLKGQFDNYQAAALVRQNINIKEQKNSFSKTLSEINDHLSEDEKEAERSSLKRKNLQQEKISLQNKFEKQLEKIRQLTVDRERSLGNAKLNRQKYQSIQDNYRQAELELQKLIDKDGGFSSNKKNLLQNIDDLKGQQDHFLKQIADLKAQKNFSGIQETDILQELNRNQLEISEKISSAANRISAYLENLKMYGQRIEELKKELTEYSKKISKNSSSNIDAFSPFSRLEKEADDFLVGLNNEKKLLSKLNASRNESLMQFNQVRSRLESLHNSSENYDLYTGVRNILSNKNNFPGLIGTVASVIDVPAEYALAIETALGAGLQNVIVDKRDTAKNAIQFLNANKLGRVTFLPLESIKARRLPALVKDKLQGRSGYLGSAFSLIKADETFLPLLENLLALTLVAKDLESAFEISRLLQQHYRIVTLNGSLVNAGGSITGGSNRHQVGLLSKKAETEKLEKQFEQMRSGLLKDERDHRELADKITSDEKKFSEMRSRLIEEKEQVRLAQIELRSAKNDYQRAEKEIRSIEENKKSLNDKIADLKTQLLSFQKQREELNDKIAAAQTNLRTKAQSNDFLENKLSSLQDKLLEIKIKLTGKEDSLKQSEKEFSLQQQTESDLRNQMNALKDRLKELQTSYERSDASDASLQKIKEAQAGKDDLAEKRSAVDHQISIGEQFDQKIQADMRQYLEKRSSIQSKLAGLESRLQQNEQKMSDLGIDIDRSDELSLYTDLDIETLLSKINKLKRELSDYSNVNLAAIDELKEVKQRYDFLNEQRQDLLNSSENLKKAMNEMDKEVVVRFKKTFEAVAEKFKETFVKLFNGGQAQLQLEKPNDLLTTGIEIRVQPPGKKLQRLSLLSGGEKALTAIALLLSILQVRPVPFVILDETEAALDEANVDNFGRFISGSGHRTQFIVITHRKGTMRYADLLYGVTMQEPGVSTMVSIDIKKAEKVSGVK
ncbi:chromosome segregation protein SMC [Oenococcus alcoholitolerans]|uniref:chromosome segregation protein SMC n=1 Tax=Oenococcus alcoholitolerans TaxID=931074 RepID=UPI003F6FF3E6